MRNAHRQEYLDKPFFSVAMTTRYRIGYIFFLPGFRFNFQWIGKIRSIGTSESYYVLCSTYLFLQSPARRVSFRTLGFFSCEASDNTSHYDKHYRLFGSRIPNPCVTNSSISELIAQNLNNWNKKTVDRKQVRPWPRYLRIWRDFRPRIERQCWRSWRDTSAIHRRGRESKGRLTVGADDWSQKVDLDEAVAGARGGARDGGGGDDARRQWRRGALHCHRIGRWPSRSTRW